MLLNDRQLECLTSPARADVLEVLAERGPLSIAEMGEALRRTPHSLYYHVRRLLECELIRVRDTRISGTREEAVYEAISRNFKLDRSTGKSAYRERANKALRSALRRAEREFAGTDEFELTRMLRLTVALSTEDGEELRRRLSELGSWARSREQEEGERYSITGVVVPVGERR